MMVVTMMNSFYGVVKFDPTEEQVKVREQKVKASIEYLGDKYLLATPIQKLQRTPKK